jgi:methyl-accepting chemotaxis protein
MAFGFAIPGLARFRLNLGPKAVISAALLIAVNSALVAGAGYWSLTRDFDTRAERDIDAICARSASPLPNPSRM